MSGQTFELVKNILDVVNGFFLIYMIIYSTFLLLAVLTGSTSLYQKRRRSILKSTLMRDYTVPVTVIVPAYNEEITVVDTVRSLLQLEYKSYEIIVVDDGSKDSTSAKLIEALDMKLIRRPIVRRVACQPELAVYECKTEKVPVTLIKKRNGGKADALNMGINASQYPYFICLDADSMLQHDSLSKIVRPVLEYEDVVAVGGAVRPCNGMAIENGRVVRNSLPRNILAAMQLLEYDRSFLASRILFDSFNGSLIISGAFGLFKKDVVIACGGYDSTTMGEDMELVVKLHDFCMSNGRNYRVCYATDAICWTQVPERLKDLCKQRKRWHIGLFQSLSRHKGMLMNTRFGLVSFVSYFYFLLYELLSPFIEVIGIISMIASAVVGLIYYKFAVYFLLLYVIYSGALTMTAFFARVQTIDLTLRFVDVIRALGLCLFESGCLRFIMAWVRASAFFGYRKGKLNWGRIQRSKMSIK